jgi:hypothetical protein
VHPEQNATTAKTATLILIEPSNPSPPNQFFAVAGFKSIPCEIIVDRHQDLKAATRKRLLTRQLICWDSNL